MAKHEKSQAVWSNYWQGRTAQSGGDVFDGVGIEKSRELSSFWQGVLVDVGDGCLVDLACGAGSAIKHAPAQFNGMAVGVDISEEALHLACEALPRLTPVVARIDQLPLADACADIVISQFGFEYAGRRQPAGEIARILRPGGRFVAIAHMADGAIARECSARISQLDQILGSRFVAVSKAFFTAVFAFEHSRSSVSQAHVKACIDDVKRASAALGDIAPHEQLAAHLQQGAQRLYDRRQAYLLDDIIGWFNDMEQQILAYRGRMQGMVDAALSADEAREIVEIIAPGGGFARAFSLSGREAAWELRASRAGG